MRAAGMTVALATYWLAGVVGAASLPPDDQYSPQQSPYKRDVARGPRGYPNWLEYHQDPSAGLEPPENKPGMTLPRASDLSRESNTRKDPMTRDLDFMSLTPGGWNVATARLIRNFTRSAYPDLDVPEEGLEMSSASREEPFVADDTFQDQGPGSVEVYKLDLRRENSLLVPQAKRKQPAVGPRIKSKIPKKAKADEILWKVKPIEPSKSSLPEIFRQPPSVYRGEAIPRESSHKIEENRKDEVFAVGGVPELQVGCEGLEASVRKRRSSEPGEEETDEEHWPKFKDPVYRESTDPILLRVTPIILDLEDETPSGQIYEELDELLKLKNSTTSETTAKRRNRGDIDPALENYHHGEPATDESLPERGDLGPYNSKNHNGAKRSIRTEDSQDGKAEGVTFPKEANRDESPLTAEIGDKDDDTLSPIIGSPSESLNHRGGRKLLWVQYPEKPENQRRTRRHQGTKEHEQPDLWGFGEEDGDRFDDEDESEANKLRKLEVEKRRREYERRRLEELERRRDRRPQSQEHSSRTNEVLSESERIRKEYDRQQENEQRERQRIEEERRRNADRRQWEVDQRRIEEAKRRQSEETRRRLEEEERKNRDPSYARRRAEEERRREWNRRREEEERRLRQESERNNQAPPSSLTRPSTNPRPDNRSRTRQEEERREAEERKLREYIERNRPIDLKNSGDRRRPENQTQWRNQDEEQRRYKEAQRRRQLEEERRRQLEEREWKRRMEDHQRQQDLRDEEERRKQMEEQRRRDRPSDDRAREDERRRQIEEQRRRQLEEQRRRDLPSDDRAREEERRRRLEEERKLQEYVRRNQPVNAPRRNSSQERDWQEQRRTINAARQWEHNKQHAQRTHDERSHGPSAPTNIGHRQPQGNLEELRRQQEAERLEAERRRFREEGRRREETYRRELSRRHEEERRRLEAARRAEEENRRRTNWQDYRRPTNNSHRPTETHYRGPGELRRNETSQSYPNSSRRTPDWSNARRRPQYEDTGLNRQRGESIRSQEDAERRRREEARLRALPVSARIIVRSDETSSQPGNLRNDTRRPPYISFGSRGGFRNEIDFPAINPNRPGLQAARFPAPATLRPPSKSPSPCVWAIVNCCPANNRLTTCFESMGCPAGNWDANPCRPAVQAAARAQVLSFYEIAEKNYSRA